MAKDLTSSQVDRQNILNNDLALSEIQKRSNYKGIVFENKIVFTKDMVAKFFEVDIRTIERYISDFSNELTNNGYEIIKGKRLKLFISNLNSQDVPDINVGNKTPQLALFDFKAFLNLGMLLSESENARVLRQAMLNIVIDIINQKTGGSTKYINQRDKDFLSALLQEDNYHKQFTNALKFYVCEDKYKYTTYTDKIYKSIFKEKAGEYKKILQLKAADKVRDTFYSEILDIIAAYECGLADALKEQSETLGRALNINETDVIFAKFESLSLWKPLIHRGRSKMASRDLALRDAFHYHLSEYIEPLSKDEYEKFLGVAGDELVRLMEENRDVLKRLKERE